MEPENLTPQQELEQNPANEAEGGRRRRRRGRGGRGGGTSEGIVEPAMNQDPEAEQPATLQEATGTGLSDGIRPPLSGADEAGRRTAFYQAARPKDPVPSPTQRGQAFMGMPPTTGDKQQQPPRQDRGAQQRGPGGRPQPGGPREPREREAVGGRQNQPQTRGFSGAAHHGAYAEASGAPGGYIDRDPKNPKLRIIPLGGLEEIGKNMTILEYGKDIMLIDMGFLFPDSDMLGVDYIIPDISYLDDKKQNIRGVVITHGHLDHIGAMPYLVERIGFPTMYGTPITMGLSKLRLDEFNLSGRQKMQNIEPGKETLQLGAFRVKTFHLAHSIPGALGLEIETPNGRLVYATDWKFDYSPADNNPVDYRDLAAIGSRGVDLLFSDSTNAEKPGFSLSERVIGESLNKLIAEAEGRIIIAMFASNLNRIQQTIDAAARCGRKVLVVGMSMTKNVEMAVQMKAMEFPKNTLIDERDINQVPSDKLLVLTTGSQGEDNAGLRRMSKGEHRMINIKPGDTVIISASPIPGNERSVGSLMDSLYKAGAHVIYNAIQDVHTTGHAYAEELKIMVALMHPRYFVPLHGERNKRITHGRLAEAVGVARENIMLGDNGSVIEMDHTGAVALSQEQIPAGYVIVDGLGVGDVGSSLLADRKEMAQEGMFTVIAVWDSKAKKFQAKPEIVTRGFISTKENEQFLSDIRDQIATFLEGASKDGKPNMGAIRDELRTNLAKVLYQKTERQPMVLPVVMEI